MEISQLQPITCTRFSLNSYSFLEFVFSIEYYAKQGYTIEQSNAGMPSGFVGSYSCILLKEDDSILVKDSGTKPDSTNNTEVQPKKAGRPAKG